MTGILKVDTIQKNNGATPTATDLGINVSGTVVNYQYTEYLPTGDISTSSTSFVEINSALRITYTPKSSLNKLILRYRSSSSLWTPGNYLYYTVCDTSNGTNLLGSDCLIRQHTVSYNVEMPIDASVTIAAWNGAKTVSPYAKVSQGSAYLNWTGNECIFQFSIMEIAG